MKTMLTLAAGVIFSTGLLAQNQGDDNNSRRSHQEDLKTVLSLDDQQYKSVQQLNEKYATRRAEVRKETREELKALNTQREKELVAVLTPEQKQKWNALKADRETKKKEATEKRQAHMKKALLLSTDQSQRLAAENKLFRDRLNQLRDTGKSPAANKEEFRKLRDEHRAAVQGILNEEQFRKWNDMRQHHGSHRRRHHSR